MVDWADFISRQNWVLIIDGIQWCLTLIAVIVGWNGFRMSKRDAMKLIKASSENRRLKAELALLKEESTGGQRDALSREVSRG